MNNTFVDNAEDLDIIPMYKFLECSDNFSITSGSLQNYQRDEVNDDANEKNLAGNCGIDNNKTMKHKLFENETKRVGSTQDDDNVLET